MLAPGHFVEEEFGLHIYKIDEYLHLIFRETISKENDVRENLAVTCIKNGVHLVLGRADLNEIQRKEKRYDLFHVVYCFYRVIVVIFKESHMNVMYFALGLS